MQRPSPRIYPSMTDYIKILRGITATPTPVTVPWSAPWRFCAPEFDDDSEEEHHSVASPSPSSSVAITFSSFGEYAVKVLGIPRSSSSLHVAWVLKTSITATVNPESPSMAYRFIDPAPFMPEWGQRVMVPSLPAMHHVVTGRLQRQNNDVTIAFIHPMPQGQVDFEVIRETLAEYLHVQMRIPTQAI